VDLEDLGLDPGFRVSPKFTGFSLFHLNVTFRVSYVESMSMSRRYMPIA